MMADKPGNTVATVSKEDVELAYRAVLDGEPIEFVSDPEAMAREIAMRAKEAGSADELFSDASLTAWGEYEGMPVTVRGFHLNPSRFQGDSSVYAVVAITKLDDGAEMLVSVGSKTVLTQLLRAVEMGWLPANVKLKAADTASGQTAYRLVAV